ncbi:ArsR/SmtB family transcription factor [Tianweitania sediminis]|uniref:Helix-turn-helix transcriptional regulator n=1 Tax=Tianweitania sediminis TaxID=1502156 RepID=A0A8J7UHY1_9HYPH|nr:helix-turn-helix transcriptional regulator [Tianweitania sediminis]MBP0437190.1 helix-turn-helix transcriptional regulator [Tianweitania sediminis]
MGNMASGNTIAEVAALIGDTARANILSALMGGQALTAGELARHAGVTSQTTSGHLAKLADSELVALEKQGRHRYYRLATPDVAQAIHALMTVAANGPKRHHPIGPRDEALRNARTCYDHLAGRLALALADVLCERGHLTLTDGAGFVSAEGERFFMRFGIDLAALQGTSKRPLCRTCLDWSERRPHIAGKLGAALLDRFLELKWVERVPDSRALRVTVPGRSGFASTFDMFLCDPQSRRA